MINNELFCIFLFNMCLLSCNVKKDNIEYKNNSKIFTYVKD
jgi:hypothetical protein